MAGNLSLSVVPAGAATTENNFVDERSLMAIKNKWEIEYSRFFNFPRPLSITSPNLRPLPKSRFRCGGTWFSSSSILALQILTDVLNPESILVVSLQDRVIEEHFICNLQFSWPQVSCVTQCPTRGSRVVFASYRDCDGRIQKFALRFSTSCDAETFIAALKESLKDTMETGFPRSDFGSEISSQSEFVSSNGLQCRDEELSMMDRVDTYSPQMAPILDYTGKQNECSQESLLGHNFERICEADLPPSFTALLSSCAAEVEHEKVKIEEDADLKAEIMRYMSDASFHDMLAKVEEVITEMGGDLAL